MKALTVMAAKLTALLATLTVTTVMALVMGTTVRTDERDVAIKSKAAIQQARTMSLELRTGRFDLAPQQVKLLEEAAAADPENAAVWVELSGAYFNMFAAASQPGGNLADALALMPKAAAANERALALAPNNPEALANHGASLAINSLFQQKPELAAKGFAEMASAVELSPKAVTPRLVRAFFGVNMPPTVRDTKAITEDLHFLIKVAEGRRAGDVLHILLGDLYAENSNAVLARAEYVAADRPGSLAHEQSVSRLASMSQGGVPAADIAALRGRLGSGCTMCHGK